MSETNAAIPKVGLGTWNIDSKTLSGLVPEAIKIGYRHFDTARKYSNEEGLGEGIKKSGIPREKIFVTSKLWRSDFLRAGEALNASLERLQLEYLDLYLLHWPFFFWTRAWASLENIYHSGKARNIGVSNFNIRELEIMRKRYKIKPFVNQIEISPFYYRKDLIYYCRENNILVEAYSPLTRGYRLNDQKIQKIADKYCRTVPQIMLAWCLQHNFIVLPKTTNLEHLKDNLDTQNIKLLENDMEYLDSLNENYSALSTFWSRRT